MANPFEKRATEYLRDDEAFRAIVTAEPVATFFEEPAKQGCLYDRLTLIIGTPGSGKTTLARLFEFTTLMTLRRNPSIANYKPLVDTLTACGAIRDERPTVVGGRLPLEAEYREFQELPYPEELRTGLMIKLLQARTVLAWLRQIQVSTTTLDQIQIIPRSGADAALAAIGGTAGPELRDRALEVERAIYRVAAALVPPEIKSIGRAAISPYRPFDVIEAFRLANDNETLKLRPLVILDDAHSLHRDQFVALRQWLARRELRVSRWVLTRLDPLTPDDVLGDNSTNSDESGLDHSRDITEIRMQNDGSRAKQRLQFRKMAKDMASRYLAQMDMFNRRGLQTLGDLLSTKPVPISPSKRKILARRVDVLQEKYAISASRRSELEERIAAYLLNAGDSNEDLQLGILSILLERYAKRVPQHSLFEGGTYDPEPVRPLTVDASVCDGARIHLLQEYSRPYYFGIETLCDASSENAEQFLHLTAELVSQSETRLIRSKEAMLASSVQHRLLRERAATMLHKWNFPQCQLVRRLGDGIAAECLSKSLEGNASLGGGATAFGIPQEEFDAISETSPQVASVLKFGVAYNAFSLVRRHRTKHRLWCLIQLGGVLLLHHGLTLKRGGFLERRPSDLVRLLPEA